MTISKNILAGSGAVTEAYQIEQSALFDQSSHVASMVRTPSSTGNRKTWTLSVWLKRVDFATGSPNGYQMLYGAQAAHECTIRIVENKLEVYEWTGSAYNFKWFSTRELRDPSAWYHVVVAFDSTQGTSTNRLKVYINGEQQTSSNLAYPNQNLDTRMNLASLAQYIGRYHNPAYSYNGYMAEFNWLDGTAAAASSFGETNSATGQWIPKEYGGSYGTNGFYLKFVSGAIGTDSSGQGNNHSVSNISNAYILLDTPTNNFATMDSIFVGDDSNTFKDGNLKVVTATLNGGLAVATFAPLTGKYYAEFKVVILGASSNSIFGVRDLSDDPMNVVSGWHNRNLTTQSTKNIGYYGHSGEIFSGPSGTVLTTAATYTTNDVIGVAIDYDNSTVKWYKNNALQYTKTSADLKNVTFALSDSSGSSGFTTQCNFGQRAFAYTPPSGYVTLSTANLPDPAIAVPSAHFNSVVWTGNATDNRAIAVGFAPNFTWFKQRTGTNSHGLFDNVRGNSSPNGLATNSTSREFDWTGIFKGHTSTGFTVGTDTAVNANSNNYVGWNWKAGGATPVKTYVVKVVSDSGNKYRFDDFAASAQTVDMQEGGTYTFDQSDSSNSNHPLRFSVTSNGSHGGGSEYTTGVVTTGSPGSSGAKTVITVAASAPTLYYYCTNHSGMGGQANTNSTRGSTNFTGSSKGIVSANVAAGFSIVSFTGTGAWQTLGHELGVIPEVVITKARSVQQDWYWVHTKVDGTLDYMVLNTDVANANGSATVPTSSVFQTQYAANQTNIAYCFASKQGFSKIGTYLGNGRADGSMVHLGFTPAWVIIKRANVGGYWLMQDVVRDPINANNARLFGDLPDAELSHANYNIDFLSNGFKTRVNHTGMNTNASTYFYMAFAKAPFKYANAR